MRIPFAFEKIDRTFRSKVTSYCSKNLFISSASRTTASWCLARYFSRSGLSSQSYFCLLYFSKTQMSIRKDLRNFKNPLYYKERFWNSGPDAEIEEFVASISSQVLKESQKYRKVDPETNPYLIMGGLEFLCNLYKIGDRQKLAHVNEICFELAEKVQR